MNLNGVLSRVKNTFTDVSARPKLVFLHVPKCGGTSIDTAIRCQYFTLNKLNDYYVTVFRKHFKYLGILLWRKYQKSIAFF